MIDPTAAAIVPGDPEPVKNAAPSAESMHDADDLHSHGLSAYGEGKSAEALDLIVRATELNPNKPAYYITLGRLLANETMFNQSALAYLRAQEMVPNNVVVLMELAKVLQHLNRDEDALALRRRAAEIHKQQQTAATAASPSASTPAQLPGEAVGGTSLLLDGLQFNDLRLYGDANGVSLIAQSADCKHFLKVEIRHNPLKKLNLDGERQVIEELNRQHCVTCPELRSHGTLSRQDLERCLTAHGRNVLLLSTESNYPYMIQQFVPATVAPSLGDILLAVLEQKSLGIFHADLRPANCCMDQSTGVCYLIDYDQAERLDAATRSLGNLEFFDWCDNLVKEKYSKWNFQSFLHYFPNIDRHKAFAILFRDGAFNLATTHLFTNQITTATKAGIYHTIREKAVFIEGERSLDSRQGFLDGIVFSPKERVLDVGCSSGIVSTYLARRGCQVTGIDLDPQIITGCRILTHILGNDITYFYHDLDVGPVPGEFDTVLLLSVIHHTKNLQENARRLASQSRRIIIECRLSEHGLKPSHEVGWQQTSGWDYATVEDMVSGLEKLFPGFRLNKNHGQGDRDRYVLEFTKSA